MEQKDREHFDNMLMADAPGQVSRGTGSLMKLMGVPMLPRPAPEGVS
jgi:hypothetical protein